MRWCDNLYMGEKAEKKRYQIIRDVRNSGRFGYYVLTPASSPDNLIDILPALTFSSERCQKEDLLIIGIAADYDEAMELAGKIVANVYNLTGGFDIASYFGER